MNSPNQTDLETNNTNTTLSCNIGGDAHQEDIDTTEIHDSHDTNEEDMVT